MATTVEVKHWHGIGAHARWTVWQGEDRLAIIRRFSHLTGWEIESLHYGVKLKSGLASLDAARKLALTLTYPTRKQVFERLHKECEDTRREAAQRAEGPTLAALARELLCADERIQAPARAKARAILANIEKFVADHHEYHWQNDPSPWKRYEQGHRLDMRYPKP